MNKKAIDLARIEYQRAAQSVGVIQTSNDFDAIESAWASFLVAAGRIYTKLEQGSKASGKGISWWGQRVHQRRTDPLLRYLQHARNVDEHTLQQVAKLQEASVQSVKPTPGDFDDLNRSMAGETRAWVPLGLVEVTWAHVKLLDVVDRGVRYSAPDTHLGQKITDTSPANITKLALAYLRSMIDEADALT